MARNEFTFLVNVRKNQNTASRGYGKYYGEAETVEPLSLKGFARHMTDHGKLASYEMVVLVLQQLVSCTRELIIQGRSVKLDGLGTFYPSIESKGAASPEDFSTQTHIKGVHMRFRPEGVKGEELTSRKLMEDCVFEMHDLIETKYKTVGGRRQSYQERKPLAKLDLINAEADPDDEDDGE